MKQENEKFRLNLISRWGLTPISPPMALVRICYRTFSLRHLPPGAEPPSGSAIHPQGGADRREAYARRANRAIAPPSSEIKADIIRLNNFEKQRNKNENTLSNKNLL